MATPNNAVRGDAHPHAIGPRMRDLSPRHRTFVQEYCRTRNATQAARAAGYKDNGKGNIRGMAYEVLHREDVSKAVHEECLRRLRVHLPVNLELVQQIADGTAAGPDDRPIAPSVRLKALEMLVGAGGAGPRVQVEHTGEVQVTVRDRWEKIARMAAARGEDPTLLLANLPEPERVAIMAAIERAENGAIDAEFEEVQ